MTSTIRLPEPALDLLEQLEKRHEEVLTLIDDLAAKIESTLSQYRPANANVEQLSPIVPKAT